MNVDAAVLVNSRFAITVDKFISESKNLITVSRTEFERLNQYARTIQNRIDNKKRDEARTYFIQMVSEFGYIENERGEKRRFEITTTIANNMVQKFFYYEGIVTGELLQSIIIYIRTCMVISMDESSGITSQRLKSIYDGITTEKEISTKTLTFRDQYSDIYLNAIKYVGQLYPSAARVFC